MNKLITALSLFNAVVWGGGAILNHSTFSVIIAAVSLAMAYLWHE